MEERISQLHVVHLIPRTDFNSWINASGTNSFTNRLTQSDSSTQEDIVIWLQSLVSKRSFIKVKMIGLIAIRNLHFHNRRLTSMEHRALCSRLKWIYNCYHQGVSLAIHWWLCFSFIVHGSDCYMITLMRVQWFTVCSVAACNFMFYSLWHTSYYIWCCILGVSHTLMHICVIPGAWLLGVIPGVC